MTSHSDGEVYLKVGELVQKLGVSRSTIYRWVDSGHFPKPLVLGPETDKNSSTRWSWSEVQDWLDTRPREKDDE